MSHYPILIKRIYISADPGDGYRILVDRLWPRGLSKERARLDEWDKGVAPTSSLRVWFGHQPERFLKFSEAYQKELNGNVEAHDFVARCWNLLEKSPVTLVYGAKDQEHNHALVLQHWLREQLHKEE